MPPQLLFLRYADASNDVDRHCRRFQCYTSRELTGRTEALEHLLPHNPYCTGVTPVLAVTLCPHRDPCGTGFLGIVDSDHSLLPQIF